MKLFTTLLVALLAGLLVYAVRQRVWLALKTAGIVYLILLPIRLVFSPDLGEHLQDLVWPAFIILVVWVVLWYASTTYERRKRQREQSR